MLRQKLNKKPPALRTYTANKRKQVLNKPTLVLAKVEPNNTTLIDKSDINLCAEESNETMDETDDVEYLTVLVANDESTESGNETIECLIEDPVESEDKHNDADDDGIDSNEEILKISLANYRRRTRNERNKQKSLTCQQCNKTLSNFSSYKYHMRLHSDDTPYLCSDCGQVLFKIVSFF